MIILLIIASTIYAESEKTDSIYAQKLIGEWTQSVKQGPIRIDAILIYKKDGTLDATATLKINDQTQKMEISGTWEVKNGYLISVVKNKSANVPMPVGHTSKDLILELTNSAFKYKKEQGKVETQNKKTKS
jgi:hypothetical protein